MLAARHPALCMRLAADRTGWTTIDSTAVAEGAVGTAVREGSWADWAAEQRLTLDPEAGLTWRLVRGSEAESGPLLLIAHQLIVDGVSLNVLADELGTLLAPTGDGDLGHPPPGYLDVVRAVSHYLSSPSAAHDATRWRDAGLDLIEPLPLDTSVREVRAESLRTATARLSTAAASGLHATASARGLDPPDLVGGALLRALSEWTGRPRQMIDLYMHGREVGDASLDVSRTVAWLSTNLPIILDLSSSSPAVDAAELFAETRREHDGRAWTYEALRYMADHRLSALPEPEIRLNYRGRAGRLYSYYSRPWLLPMEHDTGPTRSPDEIEPYRFIVTCDVDYEEGIAIGWRYSAAQYSRSTVEGLLARLVDDLTASIGCV